MTGKLLAPTLEAEPAWEVAQLFSAQGHWAEEEYLGLTTNRLVEFSHGDVKVLPMPSEQHQDIVFFLAGLLAAFVRRHHLGKVTIAPLPIQLWPGKFREPDILFMREENAARRRRTHWIGADLVVEVVSPDDPRRDLEIKHREYAPGRHPRILDRRPDDDAHHGADAGRRPLRRTRRVRRRCAGDFAAAAGLCRSCRGSLRRSGVK
jgi:hypothetical protein